MFVVVNFCEILLSLGVLVCLGSFRIVFFVGVRA